MKSLIGRNSFVPAVTRAMNRKCVPGRKNQTEDTPAAEMWWAFCLFALKFSGKIINIKV